MKSHRLLTVIVIASLMLACNLPMLAGQAEPSATPLVPLNATQTSTTEAVAAGPSQTPTITLTPTPSVPNVTPLKDAVNCRFAPDTTFESIGALQVGATADILGKSADGGWWQIQNPGESGQCWVAASVTMASGNLSGIPVVAAPLASITNVTLKVKPSSINLGLGCPGPAPVFSLKGTIYVNGPLEIKWHLETEKDGPLPEHTLSFLKFGFQDVSYDYTPSTWDKGNYWIRLIITSPTKMVTEVKYEIKCS